MGWARTSDALLAGGHPGLQVVRRRRVRHPAHRLRCGAGRAYPGAAGDTVYLGSPQDGFMVSENGGDTWETCHAEAGRSFMGTVLVDPDDAQHLIAPDMASGLVASSDGGRS